MPDLRREKRARRTQPLFRRESDRDGIRGRPAGNVRKRLYLSRRKGAGLFQAEKFKARAPAAQVGAQPTDGPAQRTGFEGRKKFRQGGRRAQPVRDSRHAQLRAALARREKTIAVISESPITKEDFADARRKIAREFKGFKNIWAYNLLQRASRYGRRSVVRHRAGRHRLHKKDR